MLDLQQAISEQVKKKIDSGSVDKLIDEQADKFLRSVIGDVFTSYGDPAKALKKRLEEGLMEKIGTISLEQYNSLIIKEVERRIKDTYVEQGIRHLDKHLDEMFGTCTIKSFSQLIEKFIEINNEHAREEQIEEIALHIEEKYSLTFVSFDIDKYEAASAFRSSKNEKEDYQCQYRLSITKEGTINSCTIRSGYTEQSKERKDLHAKFNGMDEFEGILFQLQAQAVKLKLDYDQAPTHYEWNNE